MAKGHLWHKEKKIKSCSYRFSSPLLSLFIELIASYTHLYTYMVESHICVSMYIYVYMYICMYVRVYIYDTDAFFSIKHFY